MEIVFSRKEYRKFGLAVGCFLILVFGLALPWLLGKEMPRWPFYVGVPLAGLGAVLPSALKPIYFLWMKMAEILGWVNTRIILAIFFFFVVTPVSLAMRLFSRDLLGLRLDPQSKTYWRPVATGSSQQFDRPF